MGGTERTGNVFYTCAGISSLFSAFFNPLGAGILFRRLGDKRFFTYFGAGFFFQIFGRCAGYFLKNPAHHFFLHVRGILCSLSSASFLIGRGKIMKIIAPLGDKNSFWAREFFSNFRQQRGIFLQNPAHHFFHYFSCSNTFPLAL